MRPIRCASDADALLTHAKALAALSAWSDLGLLKELADGPRRLEELSADLRALETTAPVLMHLGVLMGDGERFELTSSARRMLAAGEMPTGSNLEFLRDLSRMGDVLRDGGPVRGDDGESKVTSGGVKPDDVDASRQFLDRLYNASEASAAQTLSWTRPRLRGGAPVLDLGGGHGRYARTFADAGFPATLMDFPVVVGIARERHGDAISYVEGDFLQGADPGGPYGAALLSNIVHGQSDEENAALIRRLHDALEPGGVLVLKDMFIDEQGADPERAVFFGMTMLYYTRAGRSYTIEEANRWCAAAGFEAPVQVACLDTHSLVFARRR